MAETVLFLWGHVGAELAREGALKAAKSFAGKLRSHKTVCSVDLLFAQGQGFTPRFHRGRAVSGCYADKKFSKSLKISLTAPRYALKIRPVLTDEGL